MCTVDMKPEIGLLDDARGRVYGFFAALLSHPDEGKWGRVLNAGEQRKAIEAADLIEAVTSGMGSAAECHEEFDLRCLVLELCQPLEHLKAEFERILTGRIFPECSPFELDHRETADPFDRARFLVDLAGFYRSFGFTESNRLPQRTDHIAHELEFMSWLIGWGRLANRLAAVDSEAAEQAGCCDLAQQNFFGDHLASWVPSFAKGLQHCAGGGYLEPLGRVLSAWILLERRMLETRLAANHALAEGASFAS